MVLTAGVSTQQLNQSPQSISIQEGEDFIMNCSSSTNVPALHWYRQDPGKGLTFLMALIKGKELKRQGKITAQLDEKKQHSFLLITGTQLRDSARYFCAYDTVSPKHLMPIHKPFKWDSSCTMCQGCSCDKSRIFLKRICFVGKKYRELNTRI
uniref:Ig-like domain-containing protein n=1 Tax=Vombatus ursinus TaxID=29139 RepID=A0A4X2LYE8_VOMUR